PGGGRRPPPGRPAGGAQPAAPAGGGGGGRGAARAPADPEPPGSSPAVAGEAVGALGKLGSGQARDEVEALLRSALAAGGAGAGWPPSPVVAEALLAIWRLPRASGFAALIEPFTRPDVDHDPR